MAKHSIINWINSEASSTILARGKSYRQNVSKLKYDADDAKWTAVVSGTRRYDVEIEDLGEGDYYGECECPYDWENVCKHIVAVAYEIADAKQEAIMAKKTTALPIIEAKHLPDYTAADFYESVFLKMSIATQASFLKQLFTQNETIRNQFVNYAASQLLKTHTPKVEEKVKPLINSTKIEVSELSAEIYEGIMDLNFDGDEYYQNYDDYGGYDDDYGEGLAEWAGDNIQEFLAPYLEQIRQLVNKHDLLSALAILTAIHEAADGLPPDAEGGGYEVFYNDSFGDTVLDIVSDEYKLVLNAIQTTVLNPTDKWKMVAQLFEIELPSHFEYFEDILTALCDEKSIATKVLKHLEEEELLMKETAELALKCSEVLDSQEEWLRLALELFDKKDSVAEKLLIYYDKEVNLKAYHAIAEKTIEAHSEVKMRFVEMIKDKLDYEISPTFFLNSLAYHAEHKRDLATYQRVSTYWTAAAKEQFIDRQKNNSDFYAQILTFEERFDDLLKHVERGMNQIFGGYDLLKYIGQKYPEEAFSFFKKRFFAEEDRMRMDRSDYRSYCSNLSYLKTIDVPATEKQVLVNRLRSIYANRPAFLDELKGAAKAIGLN